MTVNWETVTETYPLPRVDDLLASLGGGTFFSKLDLKHGYQQVVLDDESKQLVTINTHKGLYRVNRLPFGVVSAPALFQRIMETILPGISNVLVYLDDILITGKSLSEHLSTLRTVLERTETAGIRLKKEKCSFLLPSVEFLGHYISAKGVQPNKKKVAAIREAPAPTDITQLRAFLGTVNYYGKFLPDVSTVLAPLYKLLQKNVSWTWGPEQAKAFTQVKELLTSERVLGHYDPSAELLLACHASPYGVGAVLHTRMQRARNVRLRLCHAHSIQPNEITPNWRKKGWQSFLALKSTTNTCVDGILRSRQITAATSLRNHLPHPQWPPHAYNAGLFCLVLTITRSLTSRVETMPMPIC